MAGNRGGRNNDSNNRTNPNNSNNNRNPRNNQKRLHVGGWINSNASSDSDGGEGALASFLARKSHKPIIRSFRQRDLYVIFVNPNHASDFLRLNNALFAGIRLTVQDPSNTTVSNPQGGGRQNGGGSQSGSTRGAGRTRDDMQTDEQVIDAGIDQVEKVLIQVIQTRYQPAQKFLSLQELHKDPIIMGAGLLSQPASKVFSALFICCETKVFETPLKRQQMVESLSLGYNELRSVKDCIAAAGTFNHIKNLDLSGNHISDIGELRYWRNRFPNLEHIVLNGNPIDAHPETRIKMKQWYPKLKFYNNQPVPEEGTALAGAPKPTLAAVELLPYTLHPEYKQGDQTDFGQVTPTKPGDQLMKEQMILRFSFETRLTLALSTQCLIANNWDYTRSVANLQELTNNGQIQDSFLWGPPPTK